MSPTHRRQPAEPTMLVVVEYRCSFGNIGTARRPTPPGTAARFLPHATDRVGDPHLPGGRSKRSIPGRSCFVSIQAPSRPTPGARETVRQWHQSTSTTSIPWPARRQAPPEPQEVAEHVQKHQTLTGSGAAVLEQVSTRVPDQTKGLPRKELGVIHCDTPICGWKRLPLKSEVLCRFTPNLIVWTAFPGMMNGSRHATPQYEARSENGRSLAGPRLEAGATPPTRGPGLAPYLKPPFSRWNCHDAG